MVELEDWDGSADGMVQQGVTNKGTVETIGLWAMPWAGQVHRLVLRLVFPWLGMRAWGWEGGRVASGRALAWDQGALGLMRGAMVAGAVDLVLLHLLALLATALCVGTGQGALKSC